MESKSLANWVQAITGVAVIVGLVLVIWELRQTRDLAYVQVAVDAFAIDSQEYGILLGENPIKVLAKDCFNEELSREELMTLHAWYQQIRSSTTYLCVDALRWKAFRRRNISVSPTWL